MSKKIKDEITKYIIEYSNKNAQAILDERTNKFKSVGDNLPADIISFEALSNADVTTQISKNKKIITGIVSACIILAFGLFFLLS